MEQLKKFLNYIIKLFTRLIVAAQPIARIVKKFLIYTVNLFIGLIVAAAQPMVRIARKHPVAFFFALIFHISLVVGLFYANVERWEMPSKVGGSQQSAPVKAVTIDVEVIKAERQRLVNLEKQKKDKLASDVQSSEAAKAAQKHAEDHRQSEEKKAQEATKKKLEAKLAAIRAGKLKKEAETKAAEAAEQRAQDEAKAKEATKQELEAKLEALKAAKRQELAEGKAKAAAEQQLESETKALEAAVKEELAEAKAKEAETKAAEAAEQRAQDEAKAKEAEKKEAIAKQLTEESRKKKEALDAELIVLKEKFEDEQNVRALITEIQAEEDADRKQVLEDIFNQLKANYINLIAGKVRKVWRYQGAEDYWGCNVHIIQSEVGDVLAVNIQNCTIDNSDKAISFKNSIERAVYKDSPLPHAPDKDLFDNEIMFYFRVNQS